VCVPSVVLFAASSEWIKCIYSRVVPALFLKHQTEVDSVFDSHGEIAGYSQAW